MREIYNLVELAEYLEKDIKTTRNLVKTDAERNNYLQTVKVGRGRNTRYEFKRENIINYLVQKDV